MIHVLLFILGCSSSEPAPKPAAETRCESLVRADAARPAGVVFVLADTLRRDRIGIHGGPAKTPHLDRFARQGVWFTAAGTPAPWTKPAMASLFTGLSPSAHGVVSHPKLRKEDTVAESDVLAQGHQTLAESLTDAGVETAGFVSNPWLQKKLGFDQGFSVWDESFAANDTPGEVVTKAGLAWLRQRTDSERPFFLYLHYMDVHSPYHPVPEAALEARRARLGKDKRRVGKTQRRKIDEQALGVDGAPLSTRGVKANVALLELVYDQGVEHFDSSLGELLKGLADMPGSERIGVVVTSDHGEALYERGWGDHGNGLYEQEVGIPMAMRLPGLQTQGSIDCAVDHLDLRRTLCDYLGASCASGQGTSMFAAEFADPSRTLLAEGVKGRPDDRSVRDARYKLLYRPGREAPGSKDAGPAYRLFDLDNNPGERVDLLGGKEPPADAPWRAAYDRLHARAQQRDPKPVLPAESVELDAETRARLEALGYLGAD